MRTGDSTSGPAGRTVWLRPDIREMEAYTPILPFEILSAQLGLPADAIVKLDANENPYGPSPRTRQTLAEADYLHIYPDPGSTLLRQALEPYTGMRAEQLLCGAGADELIDLVLRAVLEPGDVVVNCPPSFGMYPFATSVNMGRLIEIPRRPDFSVDLEKLEHTIRKTHAKVLFLCSPNNPDGSILGDPTLRQLLALPVLVVLDEAYVEFAANPAKPATTGRVPASRISWVRDHDNLVVLRTFSKWAGLAGLRVGYGAFPEWLLPHLWKIKQPYNVSVAGQQAALAALEDLSWLTARISDIVTERRRLATALTAVPYLEQYPSEANFILCRVVGYDARKLKQELAREGILVRHFAKPGLENCIRISVGRPEQTDALLAALQRRN